MKQDNNRDEAAEILNDLYSRAQSGRLELVELMGTASQLTNAGLRNQAISLYTEWIAHTQSPLIYIACFNLGVEFSAIKEFSKAEDMYRKALESNPDFLQARLNLGNCLEQQKREDDALEQWRLALESKSIILPENLPLQLHALNNLGRLLEMKKNYQESLAMLEKSFSLDTTQRDVLLHLVHLIQKICRWPIYVPPKGITKQEMINGTSPLAMLAASDDPKLQLAAAQQFIEHKYPVSDTESLAPKTGYNHGKIRIGYLSSDFCLHAVSLLMVELLELHDHDKFEVYGFCWSRVDDTSIQKRVQKSMDHYIKIGEMSDKEAADCIRSHEIDIIVDLQGLTSGARPLILSYRPATVQITYLGFPGTTGLPWIDYVVADKYLIPDELVPYHTEKPLYMPNCFQSSDSKREVGSMPTRSDNGLPEKAFVFCSFNNNYKFTPEMFAVWMRILKRVPGSVFWLLADNEWSKENLIKTAKKMGIKKECLIFAPRVAPADYLARYQLADLFLDTFPFNGGTTANDALFMGLPLLTLSGRTFASRMAGSLLTNLELPELIATSMQEYEEKAVRLAKKPVELKSLKKRLDESRTLGKVFNILEFVKNYEFTLSLALDEVNATANDQNKVPVARSSVKKRKFLIAAPKYSHHSAGIHALYNFCNSLNKNGYDAYIIHYDFIIGANPSIKFRFSADPTDYPPNMQNIKMPLFASSTANISENILNNYVVYPEVIRGNPLGAARVVRYVLNSELANGYSMEHGNNDFILTYSASYIENYHHVLYQLFYNPLFNDLGTPNYSERALNLTYIGKGIKYGPCPIISNSVELPRDWPKEKEQLASLMRSTKYIFSWDSLSQTLVDAILCGAIPVVLRYHPYLPEKIDSMELGIFPRVECVFDGINNVTLFENRNYSSQRYNYVKKYFHLVDTFDERVNMVALKIESFF
jgi:predicted O-linked N-acetylglucosamine transferase (SPINDLY family)